MDINRKDICINCGEELRGLIGAPDIPTHLITESRMCSTGKYPETLAKWVNIKVTKIGNING